ncbi:CAP domain-containing protein [Streptomyces sp. NRRL S-340]|uniref:CAP domain-containing protein n=1 Tax=Streptomyces sp. NRRL S-340 TaxID=1463901 RepID=UPI0005669CA1|nr:CAP domain-containing protein [Streptomyces sp. NRRL S-340]
MGKHRKHQQYRRIAIAAVAAVAAGAVGVPSAALACGWPGSGTHPSQHVADRTAEVQWNPSAWDDAGSGTRGGGTTPSKTPTATAHEDGASRHTATPSGPRSVRGTASPRPRKTAVRSGKPLSLGTPHRSTASAAPTAASTAPTTASAAPTAPTTASASPAPATAPAGAPPAASAGPQTGTTAPTAVAAQVLELVNAERAKAGCSALTADPTLAAAAQAHSEDMAAHQNMSHTGSDGSAPGDRITAAGYAWSTYGENVAYGYSTPEQVMAAWMASPGHKANILNCSFKEIGVGLAQPGAYWTQDFATSR